MRSSIDRGIVHQDEAAIGGGAHVQLEEIRAGIDSGLESGQRVFGMGEMFAAMGDDRDSDCE
jgi:hypothetical protein